MIELKDLHKNMIQFQLNELKELQKTMSQPEYRELLIEISSNNGDLHGELVAVAKAALREERK